MLTTFSTRLRFLWWYECHICFRVTGQTQVNRLYIHIVCIIKNPICNYILQTAIFYCLKLLKLHHFNFSICSDSPNNFHISFKNSLFVLLVTYTTFPNQLEYHRKVRLSNLLCNFPESSTITIKSSSHPFTVILPLR